ncbi:MAG: FHA domain-containing protein, partial [Candidatus Doudnabacteria bacterium]
KELKLGRFDVIGELLSPDEIAEEIGDLSPAEDDGYAAPVPATPAPSLLAGLASEAPVVAAGATPRAGKPSVPIIRPGLFFDAEAEDSDEFGAPAPGIATITVLGVDHDVVLRGDRMMLGRLSSCDICLQDKNTSREHAAFVRDGRGWAIEDLGSTNGTMVNGRPVDYACLRENDHITVGVTELIYHEPRS